MPPKLISFPSTVMVPDCAPVNLVTEKDTEGRVFVSTYPTMMGLIDDTKDGQRRFGPGHFDLVVIDGGPGQLNAAHETLAELGVADVPLVSIAKGAERDAGYETFYAPGREPFRLPPRDPVLYFIERLRDEAHRFAIGSHRARRKRDIRDAGLQEIAGIGPTRKRALLHHFGTLKAIERASVTDLAQVPGINAETARKIYDYFHETAR